MIPGLLDARLFSPFGAIGGAIVYTYIEQPGRVNPAAAQLYKITLGFVPMEFFVDNSDTMSTG